MVSIFSLQVYNILSRKHTRELDMTAVDSLHSCVAQAMSLLNIEIKFENDLFHHYR